MEFSSTFQSSSLERKTRIKPRPIIVPQPNGTLKEYDPRKSEQKFDGTTAFAQHYRDFFKAALETESALKLGGIENPSAPHATEPSSLASGGVSSRTSQTTTRRGALVADLAGAAAAAVADDEVFQDVQQVPAIQMLTDHTLCQPLELQRRKRIDAARAHEPEEKQKKDYNEAVDQNNRIPIIINAKREDLNAAIIQLIFETVNHVVGSIVEAKLNEDPSKRYASIAFQAIQGITPVAADEKFRAIEEELVRTRAWDPTKENTQSFLDRMKQVWRYQAHCTPTEALSEAKEEKMFKTIYLWLALSETSKHSWVHMPKRMYEAFRERDKENKPEWEHSWKNRVVAIISYLHQAENLKAENNILTAAKKSVVSSGTDKDVTDLAVLKNTQTKTDKTRGDKKKLFTISTTNHGNEVPVLDQDLFDSLDQVAVLRLNALRRSYKATAKGSEERKAVHNEVASFANEAKQRQLVQKRQTGDKVTSVDQNKKKGGVVTTTKRSSKKKRNDTDDDADDNSGSDSGSRDVKRDKRSKRSVHFEQSSSDKRIANTCNCHQSNCIMCCYVDEGKYKGKSFPSSSFSDKEASHLNTLSTSIAKIIMENKFVNVRVVKFFRKLTTKKKAKRSSAQRSDNKSSDDEQFAEDSCYTGLGQLPEWNEEERNVALLSRALAHTGILDTGAESTVAHISRAEDAIPESLGSLAENPVLALSATNDIDEIRLIGQLDRNKRIPPALLSNTITETLLSGRQMVATPYGYDLIFPSHLRNLEYGCLVVEYPSGKVVYAGNHDFVIDYAAPSPDVTIPPIILPTTVDKKTLRALQRIEAKQAEEALLSATEVMSERRGTTAGRAGHSVWLHSLQNGATPRNTADAEDGSDDDY